jgi:multiple sugar transport system substrate-binding protein
MRIRHGVVAALGLSLALSACSSTEDATDDSTTSASAAAGETVDLRWRTRPDNQAEADVYQKISDEITAKNIGLNLTYEAGNSEGSPYQDKLKTELSAGTAPDVFWIPGTDVADFAKSGLILNASEVASAAGFNPTDFYAGPMDQLLVDPATGQKADGFVWGVPRDVSTFALYLNLDLIDQAGVDDPKQLAADGKWTWDAFQETAKAISDLGGGVKGFGAGGWWANWGYWVNSAGGSFFNAERTACNLDSTESVNGIEYYQKLYDAGYGVKFGEDPEPVYKSGKLGMFVNGRWATPGSREITDFNWDVAPMPTGAAPGGNWQFWGAYVINAKTADPAAAWKLVAELTSLEVQDQIASLGANIPSRDSQEAVDAFLTYTPPQNNQAFVDGIQNNAAPEGPLWKGNWPEFDKATNDVVTKFMNGDITVDQYKSTICKVTESAFE